MRRHHVFAVPQRGCIWPRIDICSLHMIGWSIADHMCTQPVTDASDMAVCARGGQVDSVAPNGGAQYTPTTFAEVCRRHGIRRRMSRVGSSYDDAPAEPFFQVLKRELLHGRRLTSKAQTRLELFRWLAYCKGHRRRSPSATSRQSRPSNNSSHRLCCRSSHETRCPLARLSLSRPPALLYLNKAGG
ncbi:DDE-type integrase/transposase/recombinase [Streptomyces lasalocidi]